MLIRSWWLHVVLAGTVGMAVGAQGCGRKHEAKRVTE